MIIKIYLQLFLKYILQLLFTSILIFTTYYLQLFLNIYNLLFTTILNKWIKKTLSTIFYENLEKYHQYKTCNKKNNYIKYLIIIVLLYLITL